MQQRVLIEPVGENDALRCAWRCDTAAARAAYADWRRTRDADSYATYRALADRADAAQDMLAARAGRTR